MEASKQILERLDRIEKQLAAQEELLSVQQAAKLLQQTEAGIYRLVHLRAFPVYRPGGKRIYFRRSELMEWLMKSRESSAEELDQMAAARVRAQRAQDVQRPIAGNAHGRIDHV